MPLSTGLRLYDRTCGIRLPSEFRETDFLLR